MKQLFSITALLFCVSSGIVAQDMTLTEDLVLTETMVIPENTTINGNGFSIICDGCDPMFSVERETELMLENVKFPRVYETWIKVEGPGARAEWNSSRMVGFMEWEGQ